MSSLLLVNQASFIGTVVFKIIITVLAVVIIIILFYRRRRYNRSLKERNLFTRQLIDSMEAERKRIAAELHDSIGQDLLIIKNRALLALNGLKDKKVVKEQLNEISITASQAIREAREITNNLRPYQIDRLGLKKSIESIIERAARTTTISFTSDIDPIDNLIPKEMEIHVYRIIQECVNNIIKHADANAGKVTVKRWFNRLNIDIEDDGTGFDVLSQKTKNDRGIGIQGIMERINFLGGTIRIESNPGRGTRVLITIKTYDRIDD
ncbi:MAG: sensor histidine kinase [Bacteroidetes bacterium]|nr:sensor histidine kinase [Bacteroidota bacterium]